MTNYSRRNIQQIEGDLKKDMKKLRILLGGSPCTKWSIAQKNNRETEPNGIGWELFKNYLIAKEKFKPDYFIYENNKSASEPIKAQIRKELGTGIGDTRFTYINSALVSAQSRQRFYVTGGMGDITQPEDRGILLKDILESGIIDKEKSYALKHQAGNVRDYFKKHHTQVAFEPMPIRVRKGCDLVITDESIRNTNLGGNGTSQGYTINYVDGKSATVIAGHAHRMKIIEPLQVGEIDDGGKYRNGNQASQQSRVYSPYTKAVCCDSDSRKFYTVPTTDYSSKNIYHVENGQIAINGKRYPIKLPDGYYIIRKLTVTECCRLQTIPDWYVFPVSDTQAYKMLGNGWTVEVIKHLLGHIPEIRRGEQIAVDVLSMYDGMSCGQIALREMPGTTINRYVSYEIDKYAIQTTQANFPLTEQRGDAFGVRNCAMTTGYNLTARKAEEE